MIRMNSGIFRNFELSIWNLKLNSLDCRAWKIISNDIKLEPISWELNLKNQLFNFCVGFWVDGHPWAKPTKNWNLRGLTDNQIISPYFIYKNDQCNKIRAIISMKHPYIWVTPTQFRKLSQNLQIRFPGNLIKSLVFLKSA